VTGFELFFSFYGLIQGLSVAVVAAGLARMIRYRQTIKIGMLTPLLATFVLLDLASSWISVWVTRNDFRVSWGYIFFALFVSVTYYVSASLVFPERFQRGLDLDKHYWHERRYVLGGIAVANIAYLGALMFFHPPDLTDPGVYAWQGAYFIPLIVLFFARSRRVSAGLLAFLSLQYLSSFVLPSSNWGQQIGF
jgi:hypothetical protein